MKILATKEIEPEAVIEIEFDSVYNYITNILASDELHLAENLIIYKERETIEDVVTQTFQLIKSFGFELIDYSGSGSDDIGLAKASPRNTEEQKTYYIYFYHPKDMKVRAISVVQRMQISDHHYTMENEYGEIVIDENQEERHDNSTDIDKELLESKLHTSIRRINPLHVYVNGTSKESLNSALYEVEDILDEVSSDIETRN